MRACCRRSDPTRFTTTHVCFLLWMNISARRRSRNSNNQCLRIGCCNSILHHRHNCPISFHLQMCWRLDFPSWVVTTILDPLLHFAASSIRVCLIWLSSTIFSCSSSTSTRFHLDLSNYSSGGKNVRWQSRNQKHSLKIVNFHVLTWDGLIMQRTPPPCTQMLEIAGGNTWMGRMIMWTARVSSNIWAMSKENIHGCTCNKFL